jgi:hypothetical protein
MTSAASSRDEACRAAVDAGWPALSRGLWLTDDDPPVFLAPIIEPDDKAAFLRGLLVPWLEARAEGSSAPWSDGLAAHARRWGARRGGLFSVTTPQQRLQVPDSAVEVDAGFDGRLPAAPPPPLDPDHAERERILRRAAEVEIASRPRDEQRLAELAREGRPPDAWAHGLGCGRHRVRHLERRLRRELRRALAIAMDGAAPGPYRVDAALFAGDARLVVPPVSRARLVRDLCRRAHTAPARPASVRWAWAAAAASLAAAAAVAVGIVAP